MVRDGDNITRAFAEAARDATDPRARDVLVSLATHLHDWVRDVRLTNGEWRAGLAALTQAAAMTDEGRNEFSLFSDLFGITSLVDILNTPNGATSSSPLGPFHQRGAPPLANGGDLWRGQPGQVMVIDGRVVDAATGEGIADATLDLWQNADNGLYSVQDPDQPPENYHGLLSCARDGSFAFTTTLFHPYTVPNDGPGGAMLRMLGREAWRPAHLHVIAEAPGYRALVTELYVEGDLWLERDAAFGVRDDLILTIDQTSNRNDLPAVLEVKDRLPPNFLRARVTIRMARDPS